MSYIKDYHSLGQTYEFVFKLKCGHYLEKSTALHEDQRLASYLFQKIALKFLDKQKGKLLPEHDFNIICPECGQSGKFTEISYVNMSLSNNLV